MQFRQPAKFIVKASYEVSESLQVCTVTLLESIELAAFVVQQNLAVLASERVKDGRHTVGIVRPQYAG